MCASDTPDNDQGISATPLRYMPMIGCVDDNPDYVAIVDNVEGVVIARSSRSAATHLRELLRLANLGVMFDPAAKRPAPLVPNQTMAYVNLLDEPAAAMVPAAIGDDASGKTQVYDPNARPLGPDGEPITNVKVTFLNGSYIITAKENAWEYEQNPDWLKTEENWLNDE